MSYTPDSDRGRRWMRRGFILMIVGTGPLVAIILAAKLGLTSDPNPNPIGPGLLAFLTFWPSIIIMVVGLGMTHRDRARHAGRARQRDG